MSCRKADSKPCTLPTSKMVNVNGVKQYPSRRRRRDSAAIEGKKASPEVDLEERRTRVKRTVFYWQVGVCLLPQLFFILKTTKLISRPFDPVVIMIVSLCLFPVS